MAHTPREKKPTVRLLLLLLLTCCSLKTQMITADVEFQFAFSRYPIEQNQAQDEIAVGYRQLLHEVHHGGLRQNKVVAKDLSHFKEVDTSASHTVDKDHASIRSIRQEQHHGEPFKEKRSMNADDTTCRNLLLAGYAAHPLIQSQVDTNALYIIRTFAQGLGSMSLNNVAFEVRHTFPKVRYFRITTYPLATGFIEDDMLDVDLVPDPDSTNPFVTSDGHLTPMPINYTVWIAPAASDKTRVQAILTAKSRLQSSSSTLTNFMSFGHSVGPIAFMFRFYIPDANYTNLTGYVSLPEIRAYDLTTGQPRRCPTSSVPPASSYIQNGQKRMNFPNLPAPPNNTIGFYRIQGAYWADGLIDSGYIFTLLRLSSIEDAVLLQMRIPRYSPIPMPTNPSTDQVRCISICSAGPTLASPVGSCLSDVEMMNHALDNLDEDGQPVKVATVLLANNVKRFASQAAAMNVAVMELYSFYRSTSLVIRQKVVNSKFSSNSVLAIPVSNSITGGNGISDLNGTVPICPVDLCEASNYIGKWAPRAMYCTADQVVSGSCHF